MQPLAIPRMSYVVPTDSDLESLATTLLKANHEKDIRERKSYATEKLAPISAKKVKNEQNANNLIAQVEELYLQSKENLRIQAEKNGTVNSGLILDRYLELEKDKNEKIAKINQEKQENDTVLDAEYNYWNTQIAEATNYFKLEHEYQIKAKLEELKEKRQEKVHEVFKYNNTIDEKEQRYQNRILELSATIELKYLEISSGELSKDQLVDIGYYEDVIACVCGYYNALPNFEAYQDISSDKRLPIYLDDYYQNVVYMYKVKVTA
jgi:hypothetical protein